MKVCNTTTLCWFINVLWDSLFKLQLLICLPTNSSKVCFEHGVLLVG